ncbi:mannitol dehydrogenase domain-containing protein [Dacryopinax primogenitus]|uniref:Mannitol-1-phosphate 5-dehydrogenase n=1 Tax=Dacryopinax primogenitus (strain DJM 731) TaxID=1858805 RepID=M5FSW9_DACPD|nr:mannitol dehydrogenase domain-containing protein [Dacryopinax primogenitus]EJT98404.1 mannitol dehydrogenase domain-containing protein [Dacryopinax primogenitus]
MLRDRDTATKKALHFGAGNIGRGFIGPLLANSGYHVIFADVDEDTINKLNEVDTYGVHILDKDEHFRHVEPIGNVSGVLSHQPDAQFFTADPTVHLITTAVGPNVLPKIAPTIAEGLSQRRKSHPDGGINIIACENKVGATAMLRDEVLKSLSPEDAAWVKEHVGFANCSVDRIIPPFDPSEDPEADNDLDVGVEGFFEWVVESPALKEPKPHIEGMQLTADLVAYVERKLYTLNTGHATCAYLGYLKGLSTIDVAILDPDIRRAVEGALEQSGAALIKKHDFNVKEHQAYKQKILERFENPALKDSTDRVGRQPMRKLGKQDRLVGPAMMCRELELPNDWLLNAVAACLLYDVEDDEQAKELTGMIAEDGVIKVVRELTGLTMDEVSTVERKYEELKKWKKQSGRLETAFFFREGACV